MIVEITFLYDVASLALRVVVAIIFLSSGTSHAFQPGMRSRKIGLSRRATILLGGVEIVGALSIVLGIYIQVGAALLIAVMLGATYKKIVKANTGFYSDDGFGWHYDLLLLCANLLFLTAAGKYVLLI